MELIEVAAVLGFVGGVAALVRALWSRAAPRADTWAPYHRFDGERRRVYVRRGDELEPVGDVDAGDEDYEDRFLRLMAAARERAATLNSER